MPIIHNNIGAMKFSSYNIVFTYFFFFFFFALLSYLRHRAGRRFSGIFFDEIFTTEYNIRSSRSVRINIIAEQIYYNTYGTICRGLESEKWRLGYSDCFSSSIIPSSQNYQFSIV